MANKDVIGQSLGLPPMIEKSKITDIVPKIQNDDYEYARKNLYDVIEKGTSALEDIMDIAKQSESPRAFEVVTNLIKTMVDANKDLLELQKKNKDLMKSDEPDQKNVTNNNLILTTGDLLKMIKNNQ
ncbi:Bacteriophage T4, Gp16, DNA-packaging [uncultured Caudovirales phage]|uniref:Bacteriophage T4, Gp16, DNA-packaging n=1 Tax=uncultured Caudovirales phage TaxID=2100421 RepID=A0A6J7WX97_9CAUD|nr:Bacteriophage T4, Gp16, DNA-packaging [uncultured Caudovirales phage]